MLEDDHNRRKYALLHFKHRHEFETTEFDQCNTWLFINWAWRKYFTRREKNLEAIIDRGWLHLDRRLLKVPAILKTKIRLANEQRDKLTWPAITNPPSWEITRIVYGTRVLYDSNKLSLGIDSISLSVRRTWKLSIQNNKKNCSEWKQCWRKTMYK